MVIIGDITNVHSSCLVKKKFCNSLKFVPSPSIIEHVTSKTSQATAMHIIVSYMKRDVDECFDGAFHAQGVINSETRD